MTAPEAANLVTFDPLTLNESAKLLASDAADFDQLGWSVAISGETVIVGAHADDDNGDVSGSAHIFVRNGTTWSQEAKLLASDGTAGARFGRSVSIDGDTAIVGAFGDRSAAGAAYVFVRNGTTWSQQAKLMASDDASGLQFGQSVSIHGDSVIVGAWGNTPAGLATGAAYVFARTGTTWSQEARLAASDPASVDRFGTSVGIFGDTALVGVLGDDDLGEDTGSAYVFVRNGGTWSQQAKLLSSDPSNLFFGWSVSLAEDTAVVGNQCFRCGAAHVFVRSGTNWTHEAQLVSDGMATSNSFFGWSVSISGNTVAVGDWNRSSPLGPRGLVNVFNRSGTMWSEAATLVAAGEGFSDLHLGWSAAVSLGTVVAGAINDSEGASFAGSAFVFDLAGATPAGEDVAVTAPATLPSGGTSSVSMIFDNVTSGGITAVTTSAAGPPPPAGFKLMSPPVYYEITTTATFTGGVRVCLNWADGQVNNEANVKLFHFEGGLWLDITDPSSIDTVNNVVCGSASSLSPFTLFEVKYAFGGFLAPVDPEPTSNAVKAGAAVPVKFSLGGDYGLGVLADGYPISRLVQCVTGSPIDEIEELTATAGGSGLSYDPAVDEYTFVWKTDRSFAGSCRQLRLKLSDGEVYSARFTFRR